MRIGIHAGSRDVDQIAKECNRVGVNEIFLGVGAIPELDRAKIEKFKDELMAREIILSGMIMPVPKKEAVLGNNDVEVERMCETLRVIGQAEVGTVLFYPLDSFIHFKEDRPEKPILDVKTEGEEWDQIIKFFKKVAKVADEVNLKIANHVWDAELLKKIWDAVGSPNIGVTYCQGMYIIGKEPIASIEKLGIDRIFMSHARNLIRHGVGFPGHEEVPLDKGDVSIVECIKALAEMGYDGLVIPEHLGDGDMAEAVKYLKSL